MARRILPITRIRPRDIPTTVGRETPASGNSSALVGVAEGFLVGVGVPDTEAVGESLVVGVGLPVSLVVGDGEEVGVEVEVGACANDSSSGVIGEILSCLD
jgi:hypothetical protein